MLAETAHNSITTTRSHRSACRQRGVSLVIVLIALALLSLAAAGLIRSVDTGGLVIGNLAFKQATTSAADRSMEAALAWLSANSGGTTLESSNPGAGYYASSINELDVTGRSTVGTRSLANWNDDSCANSNASGASFATCLQVSPEATNADFTTRYIITRMCRTTGSSTALTNSCAKPTSSSTSDPAKKGELKYGEDKRLATSAGPYYRIVVRSVGPRNTTSYTESYVHF